MYQLKKGQEAFIVVDGPDSGRKFEKLKKYDRLPKGYEARFEKVVLKQAPAKAPAEPARPAAKKDGDK